MKLSEWSVSKGSCKSDYAWVLGEAETVGMQPHCCSSVHVWFVPSVSHGRQLGLEWLREVGVLLLLRWAEKGTCLAAQLCTVHGNGTPTIITCTYTMVEQTHIKDGHRKNKAVVSESHVSELCLCNEKRGNSYRVNTNTTQFTGKLVHTTMWIKQKCIVNVLI